jgi:hypothetical protein
MSSSIGENENPLPFPELNQSKKQKLRSATYLAIREYLDECGWKEYDTLFLTENALFVIDPLTGQNVPIDYAYTVQTSRDMLDRIRENNSRNV